MDPLSADDNLQYVKWPKMMRLAADQKCLPCAGGKAHGYFALPSIISVTGKEEELQREWPGE